VEVPTKKIRKYIITKMLRISSVKKEKKGKGILRGMREVKKKKDKELWQTSDTENRHPIIES